MPRKPQSSTSEAPLAPIPSEILDQFVGQGPLTPEELDTAVRRFKKAIIERALGGELTHHLGYAPGGTKPEDTTNHRNGSSGKTVLTDDGPLALAVPRDRDGSFEPRLIGKHERRFTGFDDKVVALYARGLTVREIQAFLAEMYGVDVSPDLISTVTDAVVAEVTAWQARPLEPMYPVVFFDALRVKIRDEAVVRSKAVYLALAVLPDGTRDILGIWIEQTEGAKFWMKVFTDLKARGCHDILIAVTDGLKGMSEALAPCFRPRRCRPASSICCATVWSLRIGKSANRWPRPCARSIPRRVRMPPALALDAFERGPWGVRFPTVVAVLAPRVDARDSVLCLSARGAPRDLHDECARERQRACAENHQDARPLPDRRGGDEADLARAAQHHRDVGARRAVVATGHESICDSLRGSLYGAERRRMPTERAWTLPSLWTPRTRPQRLGKPQRTRFPTAPTRIVVIEKKIRKTPHTRNF